VRELALSNKTGALTRPNFYFNFRALR